MIQGPSIFDQARAVAVSDVAGKLVRLYAQGKDFRSACPICGAGAKGSRPFWVSDAKGRWFCHAGCERGGDVIDLERELGGGTAIAAARRLVGEVAGEASRPVRPSPVRPAAPKPQAPNSADRIAAEIWQEAREINGTIVVTYLASRGISRSVIDQASARLRFHPHAKWAWDEHERRWIKAPAMVVRVETPAGFTGGVHVTYLDPAGYSKSSLSPAKRMWGPQANEDGRPGGAWLIGPSAIAELVIAEGIETALSLATYADRAGWSVQCVAALSLRSLQGGQILDDDGVFDPSNIRPDPQKPAFTWPAPDPVRPWRVVVGVDRDMSPIRIKRRNIKGNIQAAMLESEARAALCARLAVLAWMAAGAKSVRAILPGARCDFNDHLRFEGRRS